MNESRRYEHESRRNEPEQYGRRYDERPSRQYASPRQDDQWRDQGDGRFAGTERHGDDREWEWNSERSTRGTRESYSGNGGDSWNRGMDGGYRGGGRQGRMAGGFDSDRWMDAPRQSFGERDSSRSWRGSGDNSFDGGYQGGGYQGVGNQTGAYIGGGSHEGYGDSRESFTGRGPKGYQRSDDRIREEVSDRLTDDAALDASEIEVEVKHGEVTLKGTVRDRQQKRRAEDLAESCSGVSDVANNIRVSKDSQSSSSSQSRGSQSGSQKANGKGSGSDASR